MVKKRKAIVILGPTCTGKTSLALKIAKQVNGAIISADSRQVYKFMDIGTGKMPTNKNSTIKKDKNKWQIDGIDMYLYDLVFPNEDFSVSVFVEKAKQVIEQIIAQGKVPIIVGGTGFYIEVLTSQQNVYPVQPDTILRQELQGLKLEHLQAELLKLNPERFNEIDIQNPVRLIRAIEVAKSGKSEESIGLTGFEYLKIGLKADREILFSTADKWVNDILEIGLIDEVKELVSRGYKNTQPMQGMIYKTVISYLNGEIVLKEQLVEQIKFEMHNYIRRQQTYFNKIKEVTWYDISKNTFDQAVFKHIELFCNAENTK